MKNRPIFVSMIALMLMISAVPVFAKKPGKAGHDNVIEKLRGTLAQLDLTDEQKPKVDQILSDAQDKLQVIRVESKSGDKAAAKDKTKQLLQDTREQLGKVLTPEQKTKLKELFKEARAEKKSPATQPASN